MQHDANRKPTQGWLPLECESDLERLADNLFGDVKRLTNFTPEYRLRVGQYRVLFEIENENAIVVYRIVHRREAYR